MQYATSPAPALLRPEHIPKRDDVGLKAGKLQQEQLDGNRELMLQRLEQRYPLMPADMEKQAQASWTGRAPSPPPPRD